jgi:hypothetical protein
MLSRPATPPRRAAQSELLQYNTACPQHQIVASPVTIDIGLPSAIAFAVKITPITESKL